MAETDYTPTAEDMATFEHDMDVFVDLWDETRRAEREGREPLGFAEIERRVDERRREDRRSERAMKEAERTAG